jgi:hypothetical protein
MRAEVTYICVAVAHPPRLASLDFGLTVHLRQWAFCPAGESEGHEWRSVDGILIEELLAPTPGDPVTAAD